MNLLHEFLHSGLATRLGGTLLHFLWQGAALAGFTALTLAALARASAKLRYGVACLALAAMAMLPMVTFRQMDASNVAQASRLLPLGDARSGFPHELKSTDEITVNINPTSAGGTPALHWLLPWLAAVWVIGTAALVLRLAGGWWLTQRLRSRHTRPLGEPWPQRLAVLQRRLGVTRPVQLLESALAMTPMIIGWLRPVILLPVGLAAGLPPAQVEAILAHELAHLQRHDWLVNLGQRLVETVLFYHPAVWWLSARIRDERELCCDDLAAAAMGDRVTLAHALVALAERETALPAFALAAGGGALGARVKRLLGAEQGSPTATWPKRLGLILLIGILFGAGAKAWPTLAAPKLFQSTVVIKLEPEPSSAEAKLDSLTDTTWLATEIEMMKLDSILDTAIEMFSLDQKQSGEPGPKPSRVVARQRLRQQIRKHLAIRQIPRTTLVEIRVASRNAEDAKQIANALAEIYIRQRQDGMSSRALLNYRIFKQEAESQEAQFRVEQERLQQAHRLAKDAGLGGSQTSFEAVCVLKMEITKRSYESVLIKVQEYDLLAKNTSYQVRVVEPAVLAAEPTPWIEQR